MFRKICVAVVFVLGVAFIALAAKMWVDIYITSTTEPPVTHVPAPRAVREVEVPKKEEPAPVVPQEPESILIEGVPFLVQAPFAEWNDKHFQNGCEEASLIMATRWRIGKSVTKEEGRQEILDLETFQEERFGTGIDTSIEDTQIILEEYYQVRDSKIVYDISSDDIARALNDGNVVILPADGTRLKNPNFRPPGPTRHMLVVVGYDAETRQYITNDPGTKNGQKYRYTEDVLYDAILHYATGDHLPPTSDSKVMLVVPKGAS